VIGVRPLLVGIRAEGAGADRINELVDRRAQWLRVVPAAAGDVGQLDCGLRVSKVDAVQVPTCVPAEKVDSGMEFGSLTPGVELLTCLMGVEAPEVVARLELSLA
jgi:hypothetical protein